MRNEVNNSQQHKESLFQSASLSLACSAYSLLHLLPLPSPSLCSIQTINLVSCLYRRFLPLICL